MEVVTFTEAESYEPEPGWRRVAFAGSEAVSIEYFEKPPGHSSPLHSHDNEQVCVCLSGELTVVTDESTVRLTPKDSAHLESGESHRVENQGTDSATGLDVFAPGRAFDYWTDES